MAAKVIGKVNENLEPNINMKYLILTLFLCLAFAAPAYSLEARKIDEFNSVTCDDLRSRLDNLAIEIAQFPKSKGYIIVYDGKYIKYKVNSKGYFEPTKQTILPIFGQSTHDIRFMIEHLLGLRQYPKENFLFISGGYRELYTVELWLVPQGAILKPTPTLTNMRYRKAKLSHVCEGI